MVAAFIGDVTNTPVWWLFGATAALAAVTTALAAAAVLALRQLGLAVEELEEVKRDRHVEVFSEFGRRWESREMTEALEIEKDYRPAQLVALFEKANRKPSGNPLRDRPRKQAAKKTVLLLRVPNYFEDAGMIYRAGGLDATLFANNFGGVAVDEWERWGPAVKKLQETDPLSYVEFERMVREAKAVDPGSPPQA
jgi:hypothetical protein